MPLICFTILVLYKFVYVCITVFILDFNEAWCKNCKCKPAVNCITVIVRDCLHSTALNNNNYYYTRVMASLWDSLGMPVPERYQTGFKQNEARDDGILKCSGISWTICKQSATHCRQITMPVPHHSVFYWPDALPGTQPTVSKHWRHKYSIEQFRILIIILFYSPVTLRRIANIFSKTLVMPSSGFLFSLVVTEKSIRFTFMSVLCKVVCGCVGCCAGQFF